VLFIKKLSGKDSQLKCQTVNNIKGAKSNIDDTIRLMTLNLAHGRSDGRNQMLQNKRQIKLNLNKAARVIKKYKPDIISLQEADAPSVWSGNFNHVEYLAKKSGYPFYIQGEHVKGMKLAYGTAIISKIPLHETKSITFKAQPPMFSKGFVTSSINLKSNCSLEIVSLHLDFARKSVRKKQAEKIIEQFKNSKNPLIVMGDFNNEITSKKSAIKLIADELNLYAYKPYDKSLITFPFMNKRLDWILISKHLEFIKYEVLPDKISDHLCILSEIKLKKL
jgi:endonuclease/exonuclease/phosphatase family metal-dependent hydrolase